MSRIDWKHVIVVVILDVVGIPIRQWNPASRERVRRTGRDALELPSFGLTSFLSGAMEGGISPSDRFARFFLTHCALV